MEIRILENVDTMPWKKYMHTEKSFAVGGFENDQLVAFAVFHAGNPQQHTHMILDYIYVAKEVRETYKASQLLEFMESRFREKGYEAIRARVSEGKKEESAVHNLLLGEEYELLQKEAFIMKCRASELFEAPRIQEIRRKKLEAGRIGQIFRKNDAEYTQFIEEMRKRGVELQEVDFDLAHSVFYRNAYHKIKGCLLVKAEQKDIEIKYVYMDEKLKKQYALLAMLKMILQNMEPYNRWQEVRIYLQGKNYFNLFSYLLNDFGEWYYIRDYEKML